MSKTIKDNKRNFVAKELFTNDTFKSKVVLDKRTKELYKSKQKIRKEIDKELTKESTDKE